MPQTTKEKFLKPKQSTREHILSACGNCCAFPGCSEMIFDLTHTTLVGEIAHIKGEAPGSARYDKNQTAEERRHFSNLLALCSKHHKIVDNKENNYTVEALLEMKKSQEEKVAKEGDRGWLMPPNSILQNGITTYYWIDRNKRPQIYTNRHRAMVSTLFRLNMDLYNVCEIYNILEQNKDQNDFAKNILSNYGKLEHGQWAPISHIIQLMATVPDVTFGEFINHVVKGNDATSLFAEKARELVELAKKTPGVVDKTKSNQ
jgi:hypothetical protein